MRTATVLKAIALVGCFMATNTSLASSTATLTVRTNCGRDGHELEMPLSMFLAVTDARSDRFDHCGQFHIYLDGEITPSTLPPLRRLIEFDKQHPHHILSIHLNSDGGDVATAMSIARLIRSGPHDIWTFIREKDHCYSSCVLILAGGWQRFVHGEVGIHRPYFTTQRVQELGYQSLQQAYDGEYLQLKAFFASVNVSERVLEEMWNVPSDRLRVLSDKEVADYGLSGKDAILAEQENSELRAQCGENAPADWNDFKENVLEECIGDDNVLDTQCLNERGRKHPYCPCFVKRSPRYGLACDTMR